MSQCFRTISSKFPPFAGTRKQVTQFDRQLPKHIKSSTFLEEFLRTRNVLNPTVTLRSNPNKNVPFYPSLKSQSISLLHSPKTTPLSLRQNDQTEIKIAKFKELRELKKLHGSLSEIKSIGSSFDVNWRINKQKTFAKKQHRDVQEIHIKRFPFTIENHTSKMIPPDIEKTSTVLMNEALNLQRNDQKEVSPSSGGKPSEEQLEFIYTNLKKELPLLFVRTIDYTIYHPDIIFINNIRGTKTTGMFAYVKQIALLRTIGHIKFAYVKFDILKITMHPEDDSVKVRWRISGLPGFKVFVTFWRYKFWKISEALKDKETWYDGFSTFYINKDGKIYKHVADKMMPDQDSVVSKQKPAIVALFLGIENIKQIFPDAYSAFSNIRNFFIQLGQKETFLEKMK